MRLFNMDSKVFACLFLAFALSYAYECSPPIRTFEEVTFPEAVYASVTGSTYGSYYKFWKYCLGGNDQNAYFTLDHLIVQHEIPCKGSTAPQRVVYSRRLPLMFSPNPPQPNSNSVKPDYQLGKSGTFYMKDVMAFTSSQLTRQANRFFEELKCQNKPIVDTWFYVVYNSIFPFGIAELRVQKDTSYSRKTKRCPPDDSNIEKLCKSNSPYSCPNMNFGETRGVSTRNVSMYVVTGKATPGANCSFDAARYSQYLGNHYYFMGNNTRSQKMMRTVPVMTKAIRITSDYGRCKKKYQMLFYVDTAHLDTEDVPCPTQAGVMLQKVENMQIYVKTVYGNPDTDMSQVRDDFMKELNRKNLPYVKDRHYLAQYRGHGPMFGRTLEVWVEKFEPKYVTICKGRKGSRVRPPMHVLKPTAAPKSPTESMMVSYY